MECLINHPSFGSMWLSDCYIKNGCVNGRRLETIGYEQDWFWYNFPKSCVRTTLNPKKGSSMKIVDEIMEEFEEEINFHPHDAERVEKILTEKLGPVVEVLEVENKELKKYGTAYNKGYARGIQELQAENKELREAIRQCVNSPKGVVPDIVWECGLKESDLTEGKE